MRKFRSVFFLMMVSFMVIIVVACDGQESNGAEEDDVTLLNIASVPTDSGWYTYISEIANIINKDNDDIEISVREAGGTVVNATELATGNAEIGFIEAFVADESYNGIGRFKDQPNPDLRLFAFAAPTTMHWAVTEESGINSLEELDGEEFNPSTVGGGGEYITEHVFKAIGVQPEYYRAELSDAADLVKNNQLTGFSYNGNPPIPALQEVHTQNPVNILPLTDEQLEVVLDELPFLMEQTIPEDVYEGIDETQSVGLYTGIGLNKSVDNEVAYKMAKSYFENIDQISEAFPLLEDSRIEDTLDNSTIPLHLGVIQYLEEEGYDIPDDLLPPEYE